MELDVHDHLTINKAYAERYEKKKRKEELSKRMEREREGLHLRFVLGNVLPLFRNVLLVLEIFAHLYTMHCSV